MNHGTEDNLYLVDSAITRTILKNQFFFLRIAVYSMNGIHHSWTYANYWRLRKSPYDETIFSLLGGDNSWRTYCSCRTTCSWRTTRTNIEYLQSVSSRSTYFTMWNEVQIIMICKKLQIDYLMHLTMQQMWQSHMCHLWMHMPGLMSL